jgi:squalene-hopene/tetraprenyl-beta-curcumene cyclase
VRRRIIGLLGVIGLAGAAIVIAASVPATRVASAASTSPVSRTWNARTAAAYLDQRQQWWESWPKATRDHGTVCLSCHTALPYAVARPALRQVLREGDVPAPERQLLADVVKRVQNWDVVKPYYGDTTRSGSERATQSRGTESVLNAFVLAAQNERMGVVSAEARRAFANMFSLQITSGAAAGSWPWLDFDLRPWESASASFFGAALAAIAVGMEPQGFARSAGIERNVDQLRVYLRAHVDQPLWNRLMRRDDPNLFNRAMLLWASSNFPGLLSTEERRDIIARLYDAQDSDGSWRLDALGHWKPAAVVAADATGDGYATGLIAYALEQSGSAPDEPHLARALGWLMSHQDAVAGSWAAISLNKRRDPTSNVGRFMTDAATAFAALALAGSRR